MPMPIWPNGKGRSNGAAEAMSLFVYGGGLSGSVMPNALSMMPDERVDQFAQLDQPIMRASNPRALGSVERRMEPMCERRGRRIGEAKTDAIIAVCGNRQGDQCWKPRRWPFLGSPDAASWETVGEFSRAFGEGRRSLIRPCGPRRMTPSCPWAGYVSSRHVGLLGPGFPRLPLTEARTQSAMSKPKNHIPLRTRGNRAFEVDACGAGGALMIRIAISVEAFEAIARITDRRKT